MSVGLAFIKGLVGGFQRNINREREARGADDQRIAELENFVFQAATDPKKRVPEELGNILRDAKQQVSNRGPIDIFGRAGDRLNLDMSNLKSMVDEVDEKKFLQFGNVRIPVDPEYRTGKGIVDDAAFGLDAIQNWTNNQTPEKINKFKQYLNNNLLVKENFYGTLNQLAEDYAGGRTKNQAPQGADNYIVVADPFDGMYSNLKTIYMDNEVETDPDEIAYNVAIKKLTPKKDSLKMQKAIKKPIIVPFQNEIDGSLSFIPLTFSEKTSGDAQVLKNISAMNNFGDDVGRFLTVYRKQSQQGIPNKGGFEELSMDSFLDYFPRVGHAIELYRRGAWKRGENLTQKEKNNIMGYLNNTSNFSKDEVLSKISALSMLMPINEKDLLVSKYSKYKTIKFEKAKLEEKRSSIFKRYTGASTEDFEKRFKANEEVVIKLDDFVKNELTIKTSAGGITRGITKILGGIKAPTGQFNQLFDFFTGGEGNISGGGLKEGTTFGTLNAIVEKVKADKGIESELSFIQTNEALMIVLAANMARALDPAGRLSNQDFEVQLSRLGASGWFGTKTGSLSALQSVVKDFENEYKKIKVFKTVLDNAPISFNRPQLQLLIANRRYNNMQTSYQIEKKTKESKGTGSIQFDESKNFTSKKLIGPNGGAITVKVDSDGKFYYFEGETQVEESQLKSKNEKTSEAQSNLQTKNLALGGIAKQPQNETEQTVKIKMSDIRSGNNVDGFMVKGLPFKVKQLKDKTFVRVS